MNPMELELQSPRVHGTLLIPEVLATCLRGHLFSHNLQKKDI